MKKKKKIMEQALNQFFDFANPEEWELILWEWFKTTVAGNYDRLSKKERSNLITSYEMIHKIIQKMGQITQTE